MSSINSLVQPGRHIPDEQLLPELPGSLTNLRRVDSVGCSEFTDLYVGVWEQPDRSKTAVAVKCFRIFRRDLFGMVMFHLNAMITLESLSSITSSENQKGSRNLARRESPKYSAVPWV